jgi:serine/threonine protein kinase
MLSELDPGRQTNPVESQGSIGASQGMSEQVIGSYRVTELLGSGAMGEVYKATDAKMFNRVVAVKLLSEKYARNENARTRFRLEVEYATHLDHPNIVKVFDHGEHEGRPYFVMEYLDGTDLARLMKDEPSRTAERNVEIARQLCDALEFAHRHNVVHRDIKPANVMIVRRGDTEQVKLVDFGIIHVDASKMTRDGTQPGTSAYSSPEQLRNDPVDHRSDLFSLGIVLYELFTSVHPFEGASEALITHAILAREPEPPRKKNPNVVAAVDALIMKLLEKDSSQRPQTAGEVAEVLRGQLRKLHSRWASTDPAEYENLDEITREAIDKLVAWARQKEADEALGDAVEAYEKALRLAPDSDRIRRRIAKLRHRIESERALHDSLSKAEASLAAGELVEARTHLKQAWILFPDSEDVAALELRIQDAESATPEDRGRKDFIEGLLRDAEAALDTGDLDGARGHVVGVLLKYPQDPLANFLLERILVISEAGVDFRRYRAALAAARAALEEGRFSDAREASKSASAMWPNDEEVASVEREIGSRLEAESRAVAARVEQVLLRADEPDLEEPAALEAIEEARRLVGKLTGDGGEPGRVAGLRAEIDRAELGIRQRAERIRAALAEQEKQRQKIVDMFLQRGRNLLNDATILAGRATTAPEPIVDVFNQARDAFDRVLQEVANHAEALEGRRSVEAGLKELARTVEAARARAVELQARMDAALAAVADAEVARSPESLQQAEKALDEAARLDPDALLGPLRARLLAVREAVAEAERLRVEEVRRKEEEEEGRARAEAEAREAERREVERREAEARAAAAKEAEAARLREEKQRKATESTKPRPTQDARRIEQFKSGLAKYKRLIGEGKNRDAQAIRTKLEAEAAEDPALLELLETALPREDSPTRIPWKALGGIAAVGVVAAAVWFIVNRDSPTGEGKVDEIVNIRPTPPPPPPPPTPPPPTIEPQPTPTPVPTPEPTTPPTPPPTPRPSPPPTARPTPTPSLRPSPIPTPRPTSTPAVVVNPDAVTVRGVLRRPDGTPVEAGYRITFQISSGETQTVVTETSGAFRLVLAGRARVRQTAVTDPQGQSVPFKSAPPSQVLLEGSTTQRDVTLE